MSKFDSQTTNGKLDWTNFLPVYLFLCRTGYQVDIESTFSQRPVSIVWVLSQRCINPGRVRSEYQIENWANRLINHTNHVGIAGLRFSLSGARSLFSDAFCMTSALSTLLGTDFRCPLHDPRCLHPGLGCLLSTFVIYPWISPFVVWSSPLIVSFSLSVL